MASCTSLWATQGSGLQACRDDVLVDYSPEKRVKVQPGHCSLTLPPPRVKSSKQPFQVLCYVKDSGCSSSSMMKPCSSQSSQRYPFYSGSCRGYTASSDIGTQVTIQPSSCEVSLPGAYLYSSVHKARASTSKICKSH